MLTCHLQTGTWQELPTLFATATATGLLAANVLIVNNYRDMEDDKAVGKRTTVVIFGRKVMSLAYLLSGITAMAIMAPLWMELPVCALLVPLIYLLAHAFTWRALTHSTGAALNPLLGRTAANLLLFAVLLTVSILLCT